MNTGLKVSTGLTGVLRLWLTLLPEDGMCLGGDMENWADRWAEKSAGRQIKRTWMSKDT